MRIKIYSQEGTGHDHQALARHRPESISWRRAALNLPVVLQLFIVYQSFFAPLQTPTLIK